MINRKYREARDKGLIRNPREDVLTFPHMVDGVLHFNSTRVMPICTCVGEAAGTSAAVALSNQAQFSGVDVSKVHKLLDRHGALY